MPTIDEVVAAIPDWTGRRIATAPLAGGLTNTNFRVVVDDVPYFVRIPGPATDLLAIDRANEVANTRSAAQAGVGPRVLHHLAGWDAMVLEWLPGRTMSTTAFAEPGMPERIAGSLRRLHAGPRFRLDFDMFRLTERYLAVVDDLGAPIPAGYREHLPAVPRIEAALAARPMADAALPQRPAGGELSRRRPTTLARRLRVQRQQRPDVRAREHVPGAGLRRRPDRGAVRRLLRRPRTRRCSPGCGSR